MKPNEQPQKRRAKKNARILCANGNEFWTTQKQFWAWARRGLIDVAGHNPLTGSFAGRREKLIIMVRHVILEASVPSSPKEISVEPSIPIKDSPLPPSVKENPNLPPRLAEYLIYLFLSRTERENVVGDLVEEYRMVKTKFGKKKADIWFYKQVFTSLWPLARKTLVKWGLLAWLGEWVRKFIP